MPVPISYDWNPSGTAWQAPSYVDCVGIGAYVEFGYLYSKIVHRGKSSSVRDYGP